MSSWKCPGCHGTVNGTSKPSLAHRCCEACSPTLGEALKEGVKLPKTKKKRARPKGKPAPKRPRKAR